jgi:hypothetical protein
VIDARCHAGIGTEMPAPWTARGDLDITLRHMEEAESIAPSSFRSTILTYRKADSVLNCAALRNSWPPALGRMEVSPERLSGIVPSRLTFNTGCSARRVRSFTVTAR